jgi:DNA-binding PadR family transcriptional regulator
MSNQNRYILSNIEYMLDAEHIGSEYMKLNPSEERIITTLALKGFKTYYDFFKDGTMSSSTAWNLTRKLTQEGLIEVKKEEAFRIRGRPKKLYGLTFRGLIASLKLEGVKFDEVKNREELVSSWVRTMEEVDSILGISEIFKQDGMNINERFRYFENQLIRYMREQPKEAEDFFRHYDLDNSEDTLIFIELTWHVSLYISAKSFHISREQKRRLGKSLGRFKKFEGVKHE